MNPSKLHLLKPISAVVCAVAGSAAWVFASAVWAAPEHPKGPISIADVEARTKARFEALDSNGDNVISMTEFEAAKPQRGHQGHGFRQHKGAKRHMSGHGGGHRDRMGDRGPRGAQLQAAIDAEMFDILDSNADGQLSRAEHAAGHQRANRHLARQRAMFKRLDKDGNGELSAAEMPNPVEPLTAADADGDGSVTREEMRAHRQAQKQDRAG